jgi:hypothetical protein
MDIALTDMEQAINDWRTLKPSTGEERTLSAEVNALAGVYALMIYHRKTSISLASLDPLPRRLLEAWLAQRAQASA